MVYGRRPELALVTGASSGIGAATAAPLAAQGSAVALAARRRDRLEAVAAGIRGQSGTALVLECDITDQQQAAGAVARTVAGLGRLDTLINDAGAMLLGPAVGAPLPEWQQMVELNVLGLLYCAHAALPPLLRAAEDSPRQVADMVNISSVTGRVARNGSGVYNLTKHGAGAFSESLRQEADSDHPAEIQRLASRPGNGGSGGAGLACFAAREHPCRIGVLRRGLVFGGRCAGGDQGRVLGG